MGSSQISQSLQILGHRGKRKNRERYRQVLSPRAPAPHWVPIGPPAACPGWTWGPVSSTRRGPTESPVSLLLCVSSPNPFLIKADSESLFLSNISINKVLEPIKDSYSIYCLQLNVLRLQMSCLMSPPCTCSEPQVKTKVFLAGPSQCVPCVWDAADPVKEWLRGPSSLEGLARCLTQVHALRVGFVPLSGTGQGQPFTPEVPKLAVVYFSNLHHWEISRSEHDWRTFSLLF